MIRLETLSFYIPNRVLYTRKHQKIEFFIVFNSFFFHFLGKNDLMTIKRSNCIFLNVLRKQSIKKY